MKIGGSVLAIVALSTFAVQGCGGGSGGVPLATCVADGAWSGQGACGISTFNLASAASLTVTDFGANPSVSFTSNAAATEATATGLMILGGPDHTCTLTCKSADELALHCTNAGGGKCDSTFTMSAAQAGAR